MDEKEEMKDILSNECITNNEADICSFYYKAVKRLLDIDNKSNAFYLYRYAKIFSNYYDIFCQVKTDCEDDDQDKAIKKLLKESFYYRLIYVFRNGTLFSSAIAFHFYNIYKQNPNIIKRLIKKTLVKICTFGGCSVPDVVAITTVLKSIALKNGMQLDFRVTFIDVDTEWKNTCITVLSCLEEFHKASWKINFIQSKHTNMKNWNSEMYKAVQEADVITMGRSISKISVKQNIVKMICSELQSQAVLFIFDRPLTKLIELYFGISDLGDFHLIHVELCDYHTLDIETLKHQRTLYEKHFGTEKHIRSNISFNVYVSVWMKASSETDTRHKNNLECMFQANPEKYNPKQAFLSNNALTRWKNLFTKKKEAAGWDAKGIKKVVLKEKGKRNNLFGKFIPQKKEVDSIQNNLLTQVQSLEKDGKEFSETNEESLDDYLIQKRQYSLVKKNAYFASLMQLKKFYN